MHGKKAEMGVGTLIVFIAMLLVAAVAAGVLIQTAGSLQERALSTGSQAKGQISTNVRVIEVSATDGRGGNLTDFRQVAKLSPGSDPIKLDQVIFTVNTKDRTSTLKYRGPDCVCRKNNTIGYNTWNEEILPELEVYRGRDTSEGPGNLINNALLRTTVVDLDGDTVADEVAICADSPLCPEPYNLTGSGYMLFELSSDGPVYVELRNDDGSIVDLSAPALDPDGGMNITALPIGDYGFISAYRDSPDNQYTIWSLDGADAYFRVFKNRLMLDEDYDGDGFDDFFALNDTEAVLFLSGGETLVFPLGFNIAGGTASLSLSGTFQNATSEIAEIEVSADMALARFIPDGSITITPDDLGQGYFAAVYEQRGTNHVPGNLQRGDIIRICYEGPGEIVEDELLRLNFIPKIGTSTLTEFVTPDVISTERVYLYP